MDGWERGPALCVNMAEGEVVIDDLVGVEYDGDLEDIGLGAEDAGVSGEQQQE